jgi:UDP-GlcNAc:undecaprenyl-phosphate GlcNAc-1-phosphate transferase
VTVARKLSGRPLSQGGRDHTSHRLVALGVSERRAVMMLYMFAALSGGLSLAVRQMRIEITLLLIAGFALTVLFVGLYLGKVRVYDESQKPNPEGAGGIFVDVLANFSHRRRIFEILLDSTLVALAYYSAYLLRFDGDMPAEQIAIFIRTLPLIMAIQIVFFLLGGVYKGMWRYAGVDDLISIAVSVFFGSLASGLGMLFFYNFHGPSRAVFILNGVLLFLYVGASRVSFRLLAALIVGRRNASPDAKPVLIYGAGDRGDILIRELLNNPTYLYQPVGFIDDDAQKTGKLLRGYQIFSCNDLPQLIDAHGVSEVLISSLKVPESKLDDLRSMGVGLKRLRIHLD